jgi:hypothetical protein
MRRELPTPIFGMRFQVSTIPVITSEQFESLETEDAALLLRERFRELLRLGHNIEEALVIGVHPELDLSEATSLTRRGCSAATAIRILR